MAKHLFAQSNRQDKTLVKVSVYDKLLNSPNTENKGLSNQIYSLTLYILKRSIRQYTEFII